MNQSSNQKFQKKMEGNISCLPYLQKLGEIYTP
nr:MAG TPA: hypothetical protein [Caudoviricetes sp.]